MIDIGDGQSIWITINKTDVDLLCYCGANQFAFGFTEYVFRETKPVVRLCPSSLSYRISAAWSDIHGNYIKHGDVGMADKPTAVVTASEIERGLNENVKRISEERSAQRNGEGISKVVDIDVERAEILMEVVERADRRQGTLGQMQLLAFWRLVDEGILKKLDGDPQTVLDAARARDWDQRDYILALAMIVDRIFTEVDTAYKLGKPYTNPESGEPITVEKLVNTPKLIRKLRQISDTFTKLSLPDDRDKRQLLLGSVLTDSAVKVEAVRDELQQKIVVSQSNSLIDIKEEDIDGDPDSVRLIMVVTKKQRGVLMKLMKNLGDVAV